jgi:quercetin dioxygenase-like cupin family protein
MDGMSDIEKLRHLTDRLVSLQSMSTSTENGGLDVLSASGKCHLSCIYHEPGKTTVITALAEPGSFIGSHDHKETEHIVVVSGEMIAYYDDQITILHAGEHIMFAPHKAHRAEFPQVTFMIAVTVPDTEDYPHDR